MKSREEMNYLSLLSVISCFSVVALHANGVVHQHPTGRLWISSLLIESIFYFAVPMFFMITGITLLDYNERYSTKEYFLKRIKKTVIPFFFWSIFAFSLNVVRGEVTDFNILHIIENIFTTKYLQVYWYFIPLFSTYLCIPLFANVKNKDNIFRYLLLIGTLLTFLPLLCNLVGIQFNYSFVPTVINGYVYICLLGYELNKINLIFSQRLIVYITGLLGFVMLFFGTLFLTEQGGRLMEPLEDI